MLPPASLLAADVGCASAATDIGAALSITTSITGDAVTPGTGDQVFQNQAIVTDASGVGQFEFRDDTRLAVGSDSTVVIDNSIYDSDTSR